jgi:hypothetical protein
MSTTAAPLEPDTPNIYTPAIPSLPSTAPDLVAALEKDANILLVAPKMKKKRIQNALANRNAVIASLDTPASSADVRVAENKSFAAIEVKLYTQAAAKQKAVSSVLRRMQPKASSKAYF